MAQTKIEQGLLKFTEATDYLKIPTGTTTQRPGTASAGYIRFNTTTTKLEAYDGSSWVGVGPHYPLTMDNTLKTFDSSVSTMDATQY
jgi:hypothetical protein